MYRYKWLPEVKDQSDGPAYAKTHDGCGGTMQKHYRVCSTLHSTPTWGFDASGNWVSMQPNHEGDVNHDDASYRHYKNWCFRQEMVHGQTDLLTYQDWLAWRFYSTADTPGTQSTSNRVTSKNTNK